MQQGREKWSVFLHPAQREFVERDFNGPARVIGSAGTGKTVVALHRAARLANDDKTSVLLATFNKNLAQRLTEKVPLIADAKVAKRITVASLEDVIFDQHSKQFGQCDVSTEDEIRNISGKHKNVGGIFENRL